MSVSFHFPSGHGKPERRSVGYQAVKPPYHDWEPDNTIFGNWVQSLPHGCRSAAYVAYADHYGLSLSAVGEDTHVELGEEQLASVLGNQQVSLSAPVSPSPPLPAVLEDDQQHAMEVPEATTAPFLTTGVPMDKKKKCVCAMDWCRELCAMSTQVPLLGNVPNSFTQVPNIDRESWLKALGVDANAAAALPIARARIARHHFVANDFVSKSWRIKKITGTKNNRIPHVLTRPLPPKKLRARRVNKRKANDTLPSPEKLSRTMSALSKEHKTQRLCKEE
jgi:hypothetical protein